MTTTVVMTITNTNTTTAIATLPPFTEDEVSKFSIVVDELDIRPVVAGRVFELFACDVVEVVMVGLLVVGAEVVIGSEDDGMLKCEKWYSVSE